MAKRKGSINHSIKSEYPFIKGVPFFTKCPGFLEEKMEMFHF
jgi:hypothetical protein